ncbi:MAG TPA: DUF2061 domain-containing protein [Polyangia bacterium]|jgi:uncharacterized membrane protein
MTDAVGFETARRSIVKSLSWRVLAAMITGTVVFFMTHELRFAAEIGLIDTLVKLLIYFLHERLWNKIDYGRVKAPDYQV